MVLKFTKLLTDLFPKGKAWDENQDNIAKLKNGMSDEFGRIHTEANVFYKDFDLLNNDSLALTHGKDYRLDIELLNNREVQHIITEYIYSDIEFKDLIEDFAIFIGATITLIKPAPPIEFTFVFPVEFGDPTVEPNMQIFISVDASTTCEQYKKIVYITNFFKPPHIQVDFSSGAASGVTPMIFSENNQFPMSFGVDSICTI
ncbi:MAG: hypothetical protein O3C19_06960 [Bacteroidetes bacterium]|nr:hypothetical protein [Bacteroidota bacterium]